MSTTKRLGLVAFRPTRCLPLQKAYFGTFGVTHDAALSATSRALQLIMQTERIGHPFPEHPMLECLASHASFHALFVPMFCAMHIAVWPSSLLAMRSHTPTINPHAFYHSPLRSKRGDKATVTQLLACGADPSLTDPQAITPLHWTKPDYNACASYWPPKENWGQKIDMIRLR